MPLERIRRASSPTRWAAASLMFAVVLPLVLAGCQSTSRKSATSTAQAPKRSHSLEEILPYRPPAVDFNIAPDPPKIEPQLHIPQSPEKPEQEPDLLPLPAPAPAMMTRRRFTASARRTARRNLPLGGTCCTVIARTMPARRD